MHVDRAFSSLFILSGVEGSHARISWQRLERNSQNAALYKVPPAALRMAAELGFTYQLSSVILSETCTARSEVHAESNGPYSPTTPEPYLYSPCSTVLACASSGRCDPESAHCFSS